VRRNPTRRGWQLFSTVFIIEGVFQGL